MTPTARLVASVAALAVVVAVAAFVFRPTSSVGPGGPTPSPIATAGPASIEGVWDTSFSHAEMLAAGIADRAEDDPANYGHFVLFVGGGSWELRQQDGPATSSNGTYTVTGATFTISPATESVTFPMPFTATATTLTFGAGGPVTYRVKPWTRVTTAATACSLITGDEAKTAGGNPGLGAAPSLSRAGSSTSCRYTTGGGDQYLRVDYMPYGGRAAYARAAAVAGAQVLTDIPGVDSVFDPTAGTLSMVKGDALVTIVSRPLPGASDTGNDRLNRSVQLAGLAAARF